MDLKSQLENIFPNHKSLEEKNTFLNKPKRKHFQDLPLLCKYEKRKGKPITIIEGFISISLNELKLLAKDLKQKLNIIYEAVRIKYTHSLPLFLSCFSKTF